MKEVEKDLEENLNQHNEISKEEKWDASINKENVDKSDSRIARIFSKMPGMYPFEDDEVIDCVKFEPQDIGVFPMEKWPLANNSFLLHGYYTYRHLIFARRRTAEGVKCMLPQFFDFIFFCDGFNHKVRCITNIGIGSHKYSSTGNCH